MFTKEVMVFTKKVMPQENYQMQSNSWQRVITLKMLIYTNLFWAYYFKETTQVDNGSLKTEKQ